MREIALIEGCGSGLGAGGAMTVDIEDSSTTDSALAGYLSPYYAGTSGIFQPAIVAPSVAGR